MKNPRPDPQSEEREADVREDESAPRGEPPKLQVAKPNRPYYVVGGIVSFDRKQAAEIDPK